MKVLLRGLIVLAIIGSANVVQGKTLAEFVKEAENYQNSGETGKAAIAMEKAVEEYPGSSTAYAYLGLYIGMQAGETQNFIKAGRLCTRSFGILDKAVSLDSLNPLARFHRGLMGVNVPKFLGKLDIAIKDLEFLIKIYQQSPDKVSGGMLVSAYDYLGKGYQKNGENEKAKTAWKKIVEIAPGTDAEKSALENIKKLPSSTTKQSQSTKKKKPEGPTITNLKARIQKEGENPTLLLELGISYFDAGNYEEAEKVLKKAVSIDKSNATACKYLGLTLARMGEKGYDERIYHDTDLRTNLVFESLKFLDKAVALAPKDIELRFLRGMLGVNFPFFAGKLDQGIDDLNRVIKSDAPDSIKAQSLYWLGFAYQKKAMTYWINVVSKYSDCGAAQMVFDGIDPGVKHIDLSKDRGPVLVIDFVLGFRDELAPQTAVWIEDKNGKFVKTIYVSGFSGYAKEKQINLPRWSKSSKYIDSDGVTGASIDLGHHIYLWDLKDGSGRRVKRGEYIVKVEVSYWPSMKYQLVLAPIALGRRKDQTVVKEGNFIPYLEVKYLPKGGR